MKSKTNLTRLFTGDQIKIGIRLGIVSADVLFGKRPGTFDEKLRLEDYFSRAEANLGFTRSKK